MNDSKPSNAELLLQVLKDRTKPEEAIAAADIRKSTGIKSGSLHFAVRRLRAQGYDVVLDARGYWMRGKREPGSIPVATQRPRTKTPKPTKPGSNAEAKAEPKPGDTPERPIMLPTLNIPQDVAGIVRDGIAHARITAFTVDVQYRFTHRV